MQYDKRYLYFKYKGLLFNLDKFDSFLKELINKKILILDMEAFWWDDEEDVQNNFKKRLPFLIGCLPLSVSDDQFLSNGEEYKKFIIYNGLKQENIEEKQKNLAEDFNEFINKSNFDLFIFLDGNMESKFIKKFNVNIPNKKIVDLYRKLDHFKLFKINEISNRILLDNSPNKSKISGQDVRIMAMNDINSNKSKNQNIIIEYNKNELLNVSRLLNKLLNKSRLNENMFYVKKL